MCSSQPQTTNHAYQYMMAKGAKCPIQYQMKCTKEHLKGGPTSIIVDQEARQCTHNAMQPKHARELMQHEHASKQCAICIQPKQVNMQGM